MIYLQLFLTFLKIGAFTFGGGYAMISIIRESVVGSGWISEEQFLNFIAVSESTPGPFAINMATFVGSTKGGIPGAILATLGVVLPSFLIILLIAAVLRGLLKYAGVQAFLSGVRPCVVGLILATGITVALQTLLSVKTLGDAPVFNWQGLIIFALCAVAATLWKHFKKKTVSPILLILFSAGLGIVFYGVL